MKVADSPAERWMDRALELARLGEAQTSPNPMVGAVLVQDGRVVGEGFHTYAGRHHGEIVALQAAGQAARGATLYLNLEPCCHRGRTGACTDAILNAGVRRVVVAMKDPNPVVAGRGLKQLHAEGVEVEVGIRESEARRLNEAFAKWIRTTRPLVTLKSALTLDGRTAAPAPRGRQHLRASERWVTSEESRAEVQRLRHVADAVLTGIGTVLADDPLLSDRTGRARRRELLRVVVDSRLRLPQNTKLVKSADGDVLVFTTASPDSPRARTLRHAGVEIVRVPGRSRPDLRAVAEELGRRQILSVLLEAGPRLNWAAPSAEYPPRTTGACPPPRILGE